MNRYELTEDLIYKHQHKNQLLCIAPHHELFRRIRMAVFNRYNLDTYCVTFNAAEGSYLVYLRDKVNKPTLTLLRAYCAAIIDVE